jgi:putative transposase
LRAGLFEACEKQGWRLHVFVVMSNHFHLALETPRANQVSGMQWLQSMFANQFNVLRGKRRASVSEALCGITG